MKKYISRFHYLTQDLPGQTHTGQVLTACQAGANWVQYRCFTKDDAGLLADLNELAAICDDWGATLIVTDHYHLLDKADVQGVHMENMEADFAAIRTHIGPDKTLGASAHTLSQLVKLHQSGVVDYAGCGPYAHTDTKPNNFPLLGVEGYRLLMQQLRGQDIDLPVLAVGGIRLEDVEALLQTGVYGLAVSAAVNKAQNPGKALEEIYKKIC